MPGSTVSPKFPIVALQQSMSSAHIAGRIETLGNGAFDNHYLYIQLVSYVIYSKHLSSILYGLLSLTNA